MAKIEKTERPKIGQGTQRVGLANRPRLKRGEAAPNFLSLTSPVIPNPLDTMDYPGDLEGDATEEVSVILATILEERKQQRDTWRLKLDTEYWFCVCFQSREQKLEFLEKVGWLSFGEKYLDGLRCAADLGLGVEPVMLPRVPAELKIPKKLRKEVLPHEA